MLPLLKSQQLEEMKALGLKLQDYDIYSPENASLKDAVVIFGGGCTGEVVSSDGLVLTNHHCGYGAIQAHSSVEHDYLTDGFWATTRSQELPNPGLTVTFIDKIEDVTAYVKKELEEAKVELESKPIGRDALVFIVNENNPVKSLTQQQLKDIYAGKITNWKDVGGEDLNIVAFQRGEDSGSQTLFKKLLIQDGELMDPPTELAPAAMGELVDSIAAYNNSANAIGFSVYYYIDQMYSQPGLRLLAVDDVTPSNDTIADESYPLCNEFYAVIHPDAAADSPERILYDWLDTDAGQDCIKKSGYVAVGPQTTVTIVD